MPGRRGSGLAWIAALLGVLAGAPAQAVAATAQQPIVDPREFTLLFDRGSAELTPFMHTIIRNFSTAFEATSARRILVRGHADTLGSADYNLDLSRRRAEAVRDALVEAGVQADISVESAGEADLMRSTPDETAEPLNRRVTISVQP